MGRSLADFPPMPFSQQQWTHRIPNPLLQAEQYNVDEMVTLVDEQKAIFNPNQAAAFNVVLESVTNNQGYLFFIDAAGGYGKTFLCNTIAAEVRRRDQVALYMVSSGIAALLLDAQRTSHLCFKIPLSIHENSVAGLKHNSYMFLVLQQTRVIIQDEVSMQHKYDKAFIQAFGLAYEVCVEVSSLCSLPTTVCEVADSVVCQVAMLPSFNSL